MHILLQCGAGGNVGVSHYHGPGFDPKLWYLVCFAKFHIVFPIPHHSYNVLHWSPSCLIYYMCTYTWKTILKGVFHANSTLNSQNTICEAWWWKHHTNMPLFSSLSSRLNDIRVLWITWLSHVLSTNSRQPVRLWEPRFITRYSFCPGRVSWMSSAHTEAT